MKKEAIPAPIERKERCKETKCNAQCVFGEGHKGMHMANSQDFVISWEDENSD